VLASHYCSAVRTCAVRWSVCYACVSYGWELSCLSCGYYHGNAYFFLDDRLCRSTVATFILIIATFAYDKIYLCYWRCFFMITIWLCYVAVMWPSRDVHPCDMVPRCLVSRCQVSRFQPPPPVFFFCFFLQLYIEVNNAAATALSSTFSATSVFGVENRLRFSTPCVFTLQPNSRR